MTLTSSHFIIAGAGIYGLAAALVLRRRGHAVTLLDPGPLPHPLAATTDISKVVRMDYGPDEDYLIAMESALDRWRAWNREWPAPLFHETGVLFVASAPMAPGGFEYESLQLLVKRGHPVQRLDAALVRQRFPAWNGDFAVDGYYNPQGGYAESGRVAEQLLALAQAAGVILHAGQTAEALLERGGRVVGVVTREGQRFEGDAVILAPGSWLPQFVDRALPELRGVFRSPGMPVFHLRPTDPAQFAAERFPPFCADIAQTGYYGFALHPAHGVVKVANHGPGRALSPEDPARAVTPGETLQLRAFLGQRLPALAAADIVYTCVCLYCDTWDGHFWIAPHPDRPGLVLATGGSGHGFKFAPLLGDWIADAAEGRPNPALHKFRWRPEVRPVRIEEAARFQA
jgi:glycine/D-amino acid oxidase-like deaminating enzyme